MKYTKDHEILQIDNGIAAIGITSFAVKELGDLVYIELPEVGKKLKKSEVMAVIESVKAAAEVYAPVSGQVVEVNTKLSQDIEGIKLPVDAGGWIAKVQMSDTAEEKSLLDQSAYESYLQEQK